MSPKAVTLGSNTASIIEVPGISDRTYSRVIEWEDTDLDGNPVHVVLQLDRHGNTYTVKMAEWDNNGDHAQPLRHFEGYINPQDID